MDSDLGQSGTSARDREGFQKLVTEVTMGRAGIVLGLEVSRLARNSSDWHRLIELPLQRQCGCDSGSGSTGASQHKTVVCGVPADRVGDGNRAGVPE